MKEIEKYDAHIQKLMNEIEEHTGDWSTLVQCYNQMALLFQYQGDMTNAIDSFLAGIDMAEEHPDGISGGIYMNFSALCEEAGDYEKALFYRVKSFHMYERFPESEYRNDSLMAVASMTLRLYLKMQNLEAARKEFELIRQLQEKYGLISNGFEVYVNQLQYISMIQDKEKEDEMLKKTLESFWSCEELLEYTDECQELVSYLKKCEKYDLLEQVLDHISEKFKIDSEYTENINDICLRVLSEKIELYKILGNEEKQFKELKKFFEIEQKLSKERKESVRTMLRLRSTLRQTEIEKMFLTQQADMDALTGIPNRRKMNEQADRLCEQAVKDRQVFGVAMLDIDHFKDWNDTFGHHVGDQCLVALADILKGQTDDSQWAFRYGGDEFMLLFYNLPEEEIIRRTKQIQEQMLAEGRKLGLESLTVSIGIANWMPRKGNRIWDYTSTADQALYEAKKAGRNRVLLVHGSHELNKKKEGTIAC